MKSRKAALRCGGLILLALIALALLAPVLSLAPPAAQDLAHRLEGPTPSHPLGRDDLGRDVLSRLIWGARTSLPLALLVVGTSVLVGTTLGTLSGYVGGGCDAVVSAAADLLLAFPGILLAIALVAVLGPHLLNLVAALSLLGWVGYARLARGEAQRLRQLEFVAAARAAGAGTGRVLFRHLLPHLLGPVSVQAALGLGGVILAEAGLSFLGLGLPPPQPSWGGMLRDGTMNLLDAPRLTLVPGAALFLAVLGAQLTGEGLRRRFSNGAGETPTATPGL
jgi:peptide/nickel transport system permease protein